MREYIETWSDQLNNGLNQMGLELSQPQQRKLLDYLALLMKWNKAYNLTAIRDPQEMVSRQLLDSLSILPLVRGKQILDVGTGAGLPGIPLAVCMPDASFTLLDSNGKKTRFVQQAKMELGLDNVEIYQGRVESFEATNSFDTITTRAFAALPKIVELAQALLAEDGILLAMKGAIPTEEMALVREGGNVMEVIRLQTAASRERHAIIIRASK